MRSLCIAEGKYVDEGDRRQPTREHRLKTQEEVLELFADLPEAIANTEVIAKRCAFVATSHAPICPCRSRTGIQRTGRPARTGPSRGFEERLRRLCLHRRHERCGRRKKRNPTTNG